MEIAARKIALVTIYLSIIESKTTKLQKNKVLSNCSLVNTNIKSTKGKSYG